MNELTVFDLAAAVDVLRGKFPQIVSLSLFGSRRYGTGSPRSDFDILVELSSYVRPAEFREFILGLDPAYSCLDLFIVERGVATSVANESRISEPDRDALFRTLNAVTLFDGGQKTEALEELKAVRLDGETSFRMSVLPLGPKDAAEVRAIRKMFERADRVRLPTRPFIGVNIEEAAGVIADVLRRLPETGATVSASGQAATGWTKAIKSEYDFQNLFWLAGKPWLPTLEREQVEVVFDGKSKKAISPCLRTSSSWK